MTFMKKAELKQHILDHIIGCNIELKNGIILKGQEAVKQFIKQYKKPIRRHSIS